MLGIRSGSVGAQITHQANSRSEDSQDGGSVIVSLSVALNSSYCFVVHKQVLLKKIWLWTFLRLGIPFVNRSLPSCRNVL